MKRYDLIVVGAGPAGLSAAAEAASLGLGVALFDENARPGGQLFKQIHKFFGSREHKAKMRGIAIGAELLAEARGLGVEVFLDSPVAGLYENRELLVRRGDGVRHYKADAIVVATGASENMLAFEGWTLPGVMGAGAAQTMMNLNRVRPGNRALMLGSGNVGLVVGFQLLQAGCGLAAVVDAAPHIGGYGVHAAKLARTGVPFFPSHTVLRAEGTDRVTGAVIGRVDTDWNVVPGSEKSFAVDTICVAVGLSPSAGLLKMAGCRMRAEGPGEVPERDDDGETSLGGVFVAGDVSGIEEASAAMIEGRLSGLAAAAKLGFVGGEALENRREGLRSALGSLRDGMFTPKNRGKIPASTSEGLPVSESLLTNGYLGDSEAGRYPGVKSAPGVHPVLECAQNIPCNPCRDACPKGCIRVEGKIIALPEFVPGSGCSGCGMCVASCSGQAIFLVNEDIGDGKAAVTIPYEFLPLPAKGQTGTALGRSGAPLCPAEVAEVRLIGAYDHTALMTFTVPREFAMTARFWKSEVAR
ncbi:MAG: FAD-dependent oxidoreductase [Deltaproteobacteria bacterium]|jgi:NADPH-dependent 2,4-dienoyl-CoA reductase/sulfur reductase-like enzyme/Pyruvate/2-oxoacid:ferredoxin oxidoreductase delta subunit|nr:FAD-dependent oxidoreductase [Deltaproteobacteria bacterium]